MRKRTALFFFLAFSLCSHYGIGQEAIFLTNPSFEDIPRHSTPPRGWDNCGFTGESPPDTQPSGDFGVTFTPTDGETYLGMVVRDNETWEAVEQRLSRPLRGGDCYEFSLHLARSPLYVSLSRRTEEEVNFNRAARVRLYGGNGGCNKAYLLDETSLVTNRQWMQYNFKFEPPRDYTHLVIEVFYETPVLFAYNGNVIIDNASAIRPIPCSEEVPDEPTPIFQDEEEPEQDIAQNDTPQRPPQPEPKPVRPTPAPTTQPKPVEPQKSENRGSIAGVERENMKRGQTITLDALYFEADSTDFTSESVEALQEVYEFMLKNDDVKIEIGGHTNDLPPEDYCLRLSTARAKAVADYLASQGIKRNRLQYKGYGKSKPIASNKTVYGRRRNQRVEIKILEIGEDG